MIATLKGPCGQSIVEANSSPYGIGRPNGGLRLHPGERAGRLEDQFRAEARLKAAS